MAIPFYKASTFTGLVSTKNYGTSEEWNRAFTTVKSNSAAWGLDTRSLWGFISGTLSAQSDLWSYLSAVGTSNFDIATLNNYLSTTPVLLSSLNVNGQILSAGVNLFDIFITSAEESQTLTYIPSSYTLSISNGNSVSLSSINSTFAAVSSKYESVYSAVANTSANWNEAYNTATVYQSNSSSYATTSYVNNNFFPLSGGVISGLTRINNDLTVFGNLTATGTTTFANTVFSVTSALSVVHVGSGPAVWVGNNGLGDIASFYDIDQNVEVLHVGGINSSFPNVGVKVSSPNKDFTVNGEISANNTIYDAIGNSTLWNRAYNVATIVQANSASWNSAYTNIQANSAADSFDLSYVGTLPVPLIPIYTTNPLRDALLGASGSQAAAYRHGKWITGLSITGYNNPTIDNLITLSSSDIVGTRDSFSLSNLTRLTNLSFPSLVTVGNAFSISTCTVLTAINLPSLVSIGGSFTGANMTTLNTISFPSLVSVGGAFVINNSGVMNNLTTISFPFLASVGSSFIVSNVTNLNSLTSISFPSLSFVGGSFAIASPTANLNNLTSVSFPSLASVGGTFSIVGATTSSLNNLTTLNFSSLSSVGGSFSLIPGGLSSFLNSLYNASFPSLASVGGTFTIVGAGNIMNNFTTLLIGSGLKHINGDFTGGAVSLDRHNAWSANTYYPSYTLFTAPASAFSSTTTGTTCSAAIINHGLQTGDVITVSGITGTTAATHNFNVIGVTVTRIDANNFSYTITATTQIPTGTATIQRLEVAVTPITKNGRKYICTGAGTSGAVEPTWPTTVGSTIVDGTATWTCSEMSLPNILSRLDALSGTNQTTTYGANRFVNINPGPTTLITINSISTTAGVATITTATSHGITTGTQVVISGCTGTALRYNGVWTVTSTGLTTLTTPVPTDLNGVAGAGTMRLTTSCPQYTGLTPISATTVTGISADSHMIFSGTQLRDSDAGTGLPIFVAGIYNRNGTTNGFARYSCTENSWDIWYDTTSKRWVNSPSQFTGNAATVGNYPHTPQSIPLASTSSANPAVITSSVAHGITTGAVFTVAIEGCSNTALNGSWTATSTGTTTFTIPVDGSAGATTNSGTVAVLNQTFNQGRLMSGTVTSPIQGVLQTITTTGNHGFSNGDFIHFYGAVGTHATSINDSNTNATIKSVTTAITVDNANTFRLIRYANTQPFIGSYSLTTLPHMRDPSINDVAYYSTLKLRARGVAVALHGTTGL